MDHTENLKKNLISVDGISYGVVEGLNFRKELGLETQIACYLPTLQEFYHMRLQQMEQSEEGDFTLSYADSLLRWRGEPVARVVAGETMWQPQLVLLADSCLSEQQLVPVKERLLQFVQQYFRTRLPALFALQEAKAFAPITQSVAESIVQFHGFLPRRHVQEQLKNLDQASRAALRHFGVRFGRFYVYLPALIKPASAEALCFLWSLAYDCVGEQGLAELLTQLRSGCTSLVVTPSYNKSFYSLSGYHLVRYKKHCYAVRIDILERLAQLVHDGKALKKTLQAEQEKQEEEASEQQGQGGEVVKLPPMEFQVSEEMLSLLGTNFSRCAQILLGLGYTCRVVAPVFIGTQAEETDKDEQKSDTVLPHKEEEGNAAFDEMTDRKAQKVEGATILFLWRYSARKKFIKKREKTLLNKDIKMQEQGYKRKKKAPYVNLDSPFSVLLELKKKL